MIKYKCPALSTEKLKQYGTCLRTEGGQIVQFIVEVLTMVNNLLENLKFLLCIIKKILYFVLKIIKKFLNISQLIDSVKMNYE